MDTFKSNEQTKVVLTRVTLAPHEEGFFWRGEIEANGKLERRWEWDILKDKEHLSLCHVIQYLEKEIGNNVDMNVKAYINSDIGYKYIPVYVYLKHCDKCWKKLRKELIKFTNKNNREKIERKEVKKDNGFKFLMLGE